MRYFAKIQEQVKTCHSIVFNPKTTDSPGFGFLRNISTWAMFEPLLGLWLPRERPPEEIKGTEIFILKHINTMSDQPRKTMS